MIGEMISQSDIGLDNITLKHGCREFYESYPEFKKINLNGEKEMEYNNEWKSFEKIIDSREPKRIEADKKIFSKSIEGINLSDILIINNWISYAQIIGDESYKKVYDKKIESIFVNKFLEDQLEFRKKEIIRVKKLIQNAMVSVSSSEYHKFSIPLEVGVNSGNNWGEAH